MAAANTASKISFTADGQLVIADDYSDADGRGILSFAQAQAAGQSARANGSAADRQSLHGQPGDADDYIQFLRDEGRDESADPRCPTGAIDAFIRPAFGKSQGRSFNACSNCATGAPILPSPRRGCAPSQTKRKIRTVKALMTRAPQVNRQSHSDDAQGDAQSRLRRGKGCLK